MEFLREEERTIAARLALLPEGQIRQKKIGDEAYYYLQYRKNRTVKTDYIGKEVPASLRDGLAERERMQKELLLKSDESGILDSRTKRDGSSSALCKRDCCHPTGFKISGYSVCQADGPEISHCHAS